MTYKKETPAPSITEQMLPIITTGNQQLVDARLLHQKLKIDTKFHLWIKRRISEYGFAENEDFLLFKIEQRSFSDSKGGGHNRVDYHLTLDMAKELAMLEKNEIGRQIRRYFIAKEKEAAQLLMQAAQPKQLATAGTLVQVKLDDELTHNYFVNDLLYSKLTPILHFMGLKGHNKDMLERIGYNNLMKAFVGKQEFWFVSMAGVENLCNNVRNKIEFTKLNTVKRELFGMPTPEDERHLYSYMFTDREMLNILHALIQKPLKKDVIQVLLSQGKRR